MNGCEFPSRIIRPRPRKITLTGQTAVGTSATFDAIRGILGSSWTYASSGSIMRGFAAQNEMTMEKFAKHIRKHIEEGWDQKVDGMMAEAGKHEPFLGEGHVPHPFVPDAFHVLQTCDIAIRSLRRFRDYCKNPLYGGTREDVRREIVERDEDDGFRYDILSPGWRECKFHLMVDSGRDGSPDQIASKILIEFYEWLKA